MEERAKRARWMKRDLEPDAVIPMIIDYINSPMGPDNSIWNAYTGGGFYAGFVIDCDGTVIYQENWAWHPPGGQWWGLPLAASADLEAFLDNYLANPPPCYDGPGDRSGLDRQNEPSAGPRGQGGATILIVDDDGGSTYEGYFTVPVGNSKKHYDLWDVVLDGSPPQATLEAYDAVIWFTGDASTDTLTSTDQANMAAYLDGGGNLLLSGQDIGQDIGETAFYRDYLHATLIGDDTDITDLIGDDIMRTVDLILTGNDGANNQSSPSEIGLLDGAIGVFRYDTGLPAAWGGLRWEGDYKVVYFAFGLEGIGRPGAATFRYQIMRNVFGWFDGAPIPGDIDGDGDVDLDDVMTFVEVLLGMEEGPIILARADLNHDGKADGLDIATLVGTLVGP